MVMAAATGVTKLDVRVSGPHVRTCACETTSTRARTLRGGRVGFDGCACGFYVAKTRTAPCLKGGRFRKTLRQTIKTLFWDVARAHRGGIPPK